MVRNWVEIVLGGVGGGRRGGSVLPSQVTEASEREGLLCSIRGHLVVSFMPSPDFFSPNS